LQERGFDFGTLLTLLMDISSHPWPSKFPSICWRSQCNHNHVLNFKGDIARCFSS
jgi:hypothetical protein